MNETAWQLKPEHEVLGAHFLQDRNIVKSYSNTELEIAGLKNSCGIFDLSFCHMYLISGADAIRFASTCFAGKKLDVGECCLTTALSGTAEIIDAPILMRTGDFEFLVVSVSNNFQALGAWMLWMGKLENEGQRAFPRLNITDQTASLTTLYLAGPDSMKILSDYIGESVLLPADGRVDSMQLDKAPGIVARLDIVEDPGFIVMLPPALSRVFWRSFLSFNSLEPCGQDAVLAYLKDSPWGELMAMDDFKDKDSTELLGSELIRSEADFVGARGLNL